MRQLARATDSCIDQYLCSLGTQACMQSINTAMAFCCTITTCLGVGSSPGQLQGCSRLRLGLKLLALGAGLHSECVACMCTKIVAAVQGLHIEYLQVLMKPRHDSM